MSAKRGDRVAPPPGPDEWDVIFGTNEAAKGRGDLCVHASTNTRDAWLRMRTDPVPVVRTERQHPLKGVMATGLFRGTPLPQWQIEVTGGGRIWYLVDAENRRVLVMYASTRHPKSTE